MRSLLLSCALCLAAAAVTAATPELEDYADLAPAKALAIAGEGDRLAWGVGFEKTGDVGAARAALDECDATRQAERIDAPCEVVWLNDEQVTTGAEIREEVGPDPHPLFLWKITSGDAEVYLVGSIHVLKETLYPLPAPIEAAFDAADKIVVEVDTIHAPPQEMQQTMLMYAVLPPGQTLPDVLSTETLAMLEPYLAAEGIPFQAVARLKPVVLATQLAVSRMQALGYLPEFGMETHFLTRAGGRPILELETLEAQLELITEPPMALQDEMLAETLEQMSAVEPIISDMVGAWFAGDSKEFMRLFEMQSGESEAYQAFMDRLLDERNVGMADSIAGYLAGEGTYFVLVGAAHLVGDAGIVPLLERKGFEAERIGTGG